MLIHFLLAAIAVTPTDVRPGDTIDVVCTIGQQTHLQMPEAGALNITPMGAERLGIKVESLRDGRLSISPTKHPNRTRMTYRGRRGMLTVNVATSTAAQPADVRLQWASKPAAAATTPSPAPAAATPAPTASAAVAMLTTPTAGPAAVPTAPATSTSLEATPAPAAAAMARALAEKLDLEEYAMAGKPIRLNETKGMPGQRRMVLVDAQEGPTHVWFRFVLEGGASAKVKQVEGPNGPIAGYTARVEGKDLKILAQLPKTVWKARGGMKITLDNDLAYKFRLRNPGLLRVLGDATAAVNPF